MKKFLMAGAAIVLALSLTACSSKDTTSSQTRNDLTSEHFHGLSTGMAKKDVEDLVGAGDKSLGEHETLQVYGLADGTTAVLRYRDDKLVSAHLRDKEDVETNIFDVYPGGSEAGNTTGMEESQSGHITSETTRHEGETAQSNDNAGVNGINGADSKETTVID